MRAPKPERQNDIITIALKNYQSAVNESANMMKKPKRIKISLIIFVFPQKNLQSFYYHNGMLRHSLATLEGEQDLNFLYRALLSSEGSPLSLSRSLLSLLFTLEGCVHACRPEGLPEGLQ